MRIIILVAALFAAPCAWAAALPALTGLATGPARVSALVVDLKSHEILARLAPERRLTPASVSKLYTAAAALKQWGPRHRFRTHLLTAGAVRNGVLNGDLVLLGAGDPDLDHARLWRLATQLNQRGVRKITGDLIVNDSLFGPVPCLTLDRCNARTRSTHAYDSPLSAAGTNFSTVQLSILPAARAGQPASVALVPPVAQDFAIDGVVATVDAGQWPSYWARRQTLDGTHTLRVSGRVPLRGGPYHLTRSVAEPAHYTAAVLRSVLTAAGIEISGRNRVTSKPPDAALRPIAKIASPPLANQIYDMLAYSNNYMADVLTLDLAAYDENNEPAYVPLTLPRAAQRLETLAHRANGEAAGWLPSTPASAPALAIDSGSGLSVSNKLSASDVVALLAHMYTQNATFPAFSGALPVPRYTRSNRLKNGNFDWATRVAAKTGTLSEPVSVFGYAGYLRLADGGWGAFAVLVNGRSPIRGVASRLSIAAIQRDLESLLANY